MAPGQGRHSLIECPGFSILLVIYLSVNLVTCSYLHLWHLHIPLVVYSPHIYLLFTDKRNTSYLKCYFAYAQLCSLTLLPVYSLKNMFLSKRTSDCSPTVHALSWKLQFGPLWVSNGLRNIVFAFPGSFVLPSSVPFPIYLCLFSDEVSKPEYNILSVV